MAEAGKAMESGTSRPMAMGRSGLLAAIAITLIAGGAAFASGQRIWPTPVGAATPPADLLPLFIVLEAITDLLFGAGISFIVFGYPLLARSRQPLWLTYATYVAIAWTKVSWWPHGNLHRVTQPGNWSQLLLIDYGFHLTLIASIVIAATFFLSTLRQKGSTPAHRQDLLNTGV